MTNKAQYVAEMVDILPETDQQLVCEFVKKLVLAWDPDFTKLTEKEKRELENAERGEYVTMDEIDWDAE